MSGSGRHHHQGGRHHVFKLHRHATALVKRKLGEGHHAHAKHIQKKIHEWAEQNPGVAKSVEHLKENHPHFHRALKALANHIMKHVDPGHEEITEEEVSAHTKEHAGKEGLYLTIEFS